jgi:hypothetical protein
VKKSLIASSSPEDEKLIPRFALMKNRILVFYIPSLVVVVILVNQYFFCPQYDFKKSASFSGPLLYNPYEGLDSSNWKKCNFHAHVNAWFGLTNGKATPGRSMGYLSCTRVMIFIAFQIITA